MVSVLGCNSQEMLFKGFVLMRDVQSIRFSSSHQHPTESGPSQRDPLTLCHPLWECGDDVVPSWRASNGILAFQQGEKQHLRLYFW